MAYLALSPVSAAVYGVLNVASLLALAPGGVRDDVPQGVAFPLVLLELSERDERGFGGGGLPLVDLRVHGYSKAGGVGTTAGKKELQQVMQKVVELLRDAQLTVAGYTHCGRVFYDETIDIGAEIVGGVKVHEQVALFRIYVEEP